MTTNIGQETLFSVVIRDIWSEIEISFLRLKTQGEKKVFCVAVSSRLASSGLNGRLAAEGVATVKTRRR
jgi:hypothetical protein